MGDGVLVADSFAPPQAVAIARIIRARAVARKRCGARRRPLLGTPCVSIETSGKWLGIEEIGPRDSHLTGEVGLHPISIGCGVPAEHLVIMITTEVVMDPLEVTEKERLSREAAAERLHALADALARNNEVECERGGVRFKSARG